MHIIKIVLVVLLPLLFGCQPSGKNEGESPSIESIARKKFETPVHYLDNKNSSFTICYSQKAATALMPYTPLHYFVFNNLTKTIIFEDNLANGSIKWVRKYRFEVTIVPGIVSIDQENNSNKYVYDVQLKKKIKPGE